MTQPRGFLFAGVHAGIKAHRKDLALVFSEAPCAAAGCFTRNLARAAPVVDAQARLPADGIHAVVVNSGNANALTGPEGVRDAQQVAAEAARALGVPAAGVLTASTGIIGHRLPVQKLAAALPALAASRSTDPLMAAEAILTTDTKVKTAWRTLQVGGVEVRLGAVAKGSGMIHPSLATVIGIVFTDCAIRPGALATALRAAVRPSFNCLTVDGDMSTNDSVFALANGLAGNAPITDPGPALDAFTEALTGLCQDLARQVAADGEGATKLFEVQLTGAPDDAVGVDLARAVAGSSLVKAALFGADPNWGRILSTVGARAGTQGYAVDPAEARVSVQGVPVFDRAPVPFDAAALRVRMREPEVKVAIDLRAGSGVATAWGCDLSYDYVKINADYASVISPSPEGQVTRDARLTNYSPGFKASLLVEALSYISRFAGTRCVIKYGGEAMEKDSLKHAFCQDIELLRSAGLQPIVVHGGGSEISRTLQKLGGSSAFVDGVRITQPSDLKVVEMVLGSVNTELVTLLNHRGNRAVGVSGKDAALLRARRRAPLHGVDLGQVGEVVGVNTELLELLLKQGFVPVISPVAMGDDGQSYNVNADEVAAVVAGGLHASKLIYLTDVPGLLQGEELIPDLKEQELTQRLTGDGITGRMRSKVESALRALGAGVERVHLIDGRVPHSLIAELFTDRGVGTLITR